MLGMRNYGIQKMLHMSSLQWRKVLSMSTPCSKPRTPKPYTTKGRHQHRHKRWWTWRVSEVQTEGIWVHRISKHWRCLPFMLTSCCPACNSWLLLVKSVDAIFFGFMHITSAIYWPNFQKDPKSIEKAQRTFGFGLKEKWYSIVIYIWWPLIFFPISVI